MPTLIVRRLRPTVVAIIALAALAGSALAYAVNPDVGHSTSGSCNWFRESVFTYSPSNLGISYTGKDSGTCDSQYHVHAYFWGSDLAWHYYEKTDYASTQIQVSYPWWTDNIYGYHQYPAGTTTLTTNAQ
jgi:hypothetical protein